MHHCPYITCTLAFDASNVSVMSCAAGGVGEFHSSCYALSAGSAAEGSHHVSYVDKVVLCADLIKTSMGTSVHVLFGPHALFCLRVQTLVIILEDTKTKKTTFVRLCKHACVAFVRIRGQRLGLGHQIHITVYS